MPTACSKKELAKLLKVSPRTITRWVKDYGLPATKKAIYPDRNNHVWQYHFELDQVDKWMSTRAALFKGVESK